MSLPCTFHTYTHTHFFPQHCISIKPVRRSTYPMRLIGFFSIDLHSTLPCIPGVQQSSAPIDFISVVEKHFLEHLKHFYTLYNKKLKLVSHINTLEVRPFYFSFVRHRAQALKAPWEYRRWQRAGYQRLPNYYFPEFPGGALPFHYYSSYLGLVGIGIGTHFVFGMGSHDTKHVSVSYHVSHLLSTTLWWRNDVRIGLSQPPFSTITLGFGQVKFREIYN